MRDVIFKIAKIARWYLWVLTFFASFLIAVVALVERKDWLTTLTELAAKDDSGIGRIWKALKEAAPVIMIVEAMLLLALLSTVFYLLITRVREDAGKQRSVLFVAPKLGGFYAEYLTALVHAARKAASAKLDLVITPYTLTLDSDDDSFCPEKRLCEIVEQMPSKPAGVFMIPLSPGERENQDAIKHFCSKHGDIKLVTLDVYPATSELDGYPHFVGGDEEEGGRLAAIHAKSAIESAHYGSPENSDQQSTIHVLVLIGENTAWEEQRAESFERHLTNIHEELRNQNGAALVELSITRSIPLCYSTDRAFTYLRHWELSKDHKGERLRHPDSYQLIFACNDDMALGAARALGTISQARVNQPGAAASSPRRPQVIGYDGTTIMKTVLELGHSPVSHTVCVNLRGQAARAVSVMSDLLTGNVPERLHKVPPQPWSRT